MKIRIMLSIFTILSFGFAIVLAHSLSAPPPTPPPAAGAYVNPGTGWTPLTAGGSGAPLSFTPPPSALYVLSGGAWIPWTGTGGGGGGTCPAGAANTIQKTDGTNCVASNLQDNGTDAIIYGSIVGPLFTGGYEGISFNNQGPGSVHQMSIVGDFSGTDKTMYLGVDTGGTWNFRIASGSIAALSATGFTFGLLDVPLISGTATVGQVACIKAAGPPVVFGFCSTTPTSGTCTCN